MTRELIFDTESKEPARKIEREPVGYLHACRNGQRTALPFYHGQNSFGEPGTFLGIPEKDEFSDLRGYPLYASQQWLVSNGYTYEVT